LTTLAVVGAGPKGVAVAAKARALRDAGLDAPRVVLIDRAAVASSWDGANGFTTVELKCNFMGTLNAGAILGEATLLHGGRTTQVWDAKITNEDSGKLLAAFRCTQMILYPR